MRIASQATQEFTSGSLLHDTGSEVEGEHGGALLLLLVQLVGVDLPLSYRKWLRLVSWKIFWHWLDIEEDRLLGDSIMILSMDDELSSVVNLASVDDEGVVVADVPLHVLDTLSKFHIVVIPCDRAICQ